MLKNILLILCCLCYSVAASSFICSVLAFAQGKSRDHCVDYYAETGQPCRSNANCSSHLLQCINGVCLCDTSQSHYAFNFTDVGNQQAAACQSLKAKKCTSVYKPQSCSCGRGNLAFVIQDQQEGSCVYSGNIGLGHGEYCSSLQNACQPRSLLTCREHRCLCPLHTHVYNFNLQRCIKDVNHRLGYGQQCSSKDGCEDRFICSAKGTCTCPDSCRPYLEEEGICACEYNRGWRLLLYKVLPLAGLLVMLVLMAGAIWYAIRRRNRSSGQSNGPQHWSYGTGQSPIAVPLTDPSQHGHLDGTTTTWAEADWSIATAPSLPLDDDAPPTYDEAVRGPAPGAPPSPP